MRMLSFFQYVDSEVWKDKNGLPKVGAVGYNENDLIFEQLRQWYCK